LADIVQFRLLMIAAGYEAVIQRAAQTCHVQDGARRDAFASPDLCSQSTISRLENLPDMRALLRTGRAHIA
jgi:hypothetical protein